MQITEPGEWLPTLDVPGRSSYCQGYKQVCRCSGPYYQEPLPFRRIRKPGLPVLSLACPSAQRGISFTTGPLILRIYFFWFCIVGPRLTGWCGQQGRGGISRQTETSSWNRTSLSCPRPCLHQPPFSPKKIITAQLLCSGRPRLLKSSYLFSLSICGSRGWGGGSRVLACESASRKCENIAQSL